MNIDSILTRLFSNKASKEELAHLESWKLEADQNIEALQEMEALWKETEALKSYKTFDTSKAMQKLNAKLVDEELKSAPQAAPASSKVVRLAKRLIPLAASILLIAVVFNKFNGSTSGPETYVKTAEQDNYLLADQTKISLDDQGQVSILSDFGTARNVAVQGRVLFDVAKDKSRPFTVQTNHGKIKVTGTVFSVRTNDDMTEVYLKEGAIDFSFGGKTIELNPSEAIRALADGTLTKYTVNDPNILSWNTDLLVFDDQYASDIFSSLAAHYGVEIILKEQRIDAQCKLSSQFKNRALKEVLEELSEIWSLKYIIEDGKVTIQHLSC